MSKQERGNFSENDLTPEEWDDKMLGDRAKPRLDLDKAKTSEQRESMVKEWVAWAVKQIEIGNYYNELRWGSNNNDKNKIPKEVYESEEVASAFVKRVKEYILEQGKRGFYANDFDTIRDLTRKFSLPEDTFCDELKKVAENRIDTLIAWEPSEHFDTYPSDDMRAFEAIMKDFKITDSDLGERYKQAVKQVNEKKEIWYSKHGYKKYGNRWIHP